MPARKENKKKEFEPDFTSEEQNIGEKKKRIYPNIHQPEFTSEELNARMNEKYILKLSLPQKPNRNNERKRQVERGSISDEQTAKNKQSESDSEEQSEEEKKQYRFEPEFA